MTGFVIRPAGADDVTALAHIHTEGWKAAYGGIIDPEFLNNLKEEDRAADWARWLAEGQSHVAITTTADGTPCGFVSYGRLRTPIPGMSPIRPLYSGEIYALYILPSFWRQGLGSRLMKEAAEGLRALKHSSMCLWVLEKNDRAVSFYKKCGGERCGKKDVQIGKSTVREVAFGWRRTNVQWP